MICYALSEHGYFYQVPQGPIKYYDNVSQLPFYKHCLTHLHVVDLPEKASDKYRLLKRSIDGVLFNEYFTHKFLKQIVQRQIVPIFNITYLSSLIMKKQFKKVKMMMEGYRYMSAHVIPLIVYTHTEHCSLPTLIKYFM